MDRGSAAAEARRPVAEGAAAGGLAEGAGAEPEPEPERAGRGGQSAQPAGPELAPEGQCSCRPRPPEALPPSESWVLSINTGSIHRQSSSSSSSSSSSASLSSSITPISLNVSIC